MFGKMIDRRGLLLAAVGLFTLVAFCWCLPGDQSVGKPQVGRANFHTGARLINYGHQPVRSSGAIDTAARGLSLKQSARAAKKAAINRKRAQLARSMSRIKRRITDDCVAGEECEEEEDQQQEHSSPNLFHNMNQLRGDLIQTSKDQKNSLAEAKKTKVKEEREAEEKIKSKSEGLNAGLSARVDLKNPALEFSTGFDLGKTIFDKVKNVEAERKEQSLTGKLSELVSEERGVSAEDALLDNPIVSGVKQAIKSPLNDIKEALDNPLDKAGDIVGDPDDEVTDLVKGPLGKVGDIVRDPVGKIQETFEERAGHGDGILTTPLELIKEGAHKLAEKPKEIIGGVHEKVKDLVKIPKKIVEHVKEGVHDKVEDLVDIPKKVVEHVKDRLEDVHEKVEDLVEIPKNIVEHVKDGVDGAHEFVEDVVEEGVENLAEKPVEKVVGLAKGLGIGVKDFIEDAAEIKEEALEGAIELKEELGEKLHHHHHHQKHEQNHHHPKPHKHHHHHHHHYQSYPNKPTYGGHQPNYGAQPSYTAQPAYGPQANYPVANVAYGGAYPTTGNGYQPNSYNSQANSYKPAYYQQPPNQAGYVSSGGYGQPVPLPVPQPKVHQPQVYHRPEPVKGFQPKCLAISMGLKGLLSTLLHRLNLLSQLIHSSKLHFVLLKTLASRLAQIKLGLEEALEALEAYNFVALKQTVPLLLKQLARLVSVGHVAKLDPLLKPLLIKIRILFTNLLAHCKY